MCIYSVLPEMEICTKWDDKEYPEKDNNKGEKEGGGLHGEVVQYKPHQSHVWL